MSDSLCWAQPQDRPEHRAGDSCPGASDSALSWFYCWDLGSKGKRWREKVGKGKAVCS